MHWPRNAPMIKSLASHIISNSSDQSGEVMMGAKIKLSFNLLNASKHTLSKL